MTETEPEAKFKVLILTHKYQIEGFIAHFENMRLTDFMSEAKPFLAVTDANVKDSHGKNLFSAPFLDVNTNQIEVIVPAEDVIMELELP